MASPQLASQLSSIDLSFIVFGVPRSGTSATARFLNAAPQIHCSHELVQPSQDHRGLSLPGWVVNAPAMQVADGPHHKLAVEELAQLEAKADTLRVGGNKMPQYYFRLKQVLAEIGTGRGILSWRAPRLVMQSYTMRARSPEDAWHPGQTGLFAFGEILRLAHALLEAAEGTNILVSPIATLSARPEWVRLRLGRHVAPGVDLDWPAPEADCWNHETRARGRLDRPDISAVELDALEMLEASGLTAVFDRPGPFLLRDVIDPLARAVHRLPSDPDGYISDLATQQADPDMAAFLPDWLHAGGQRQVLRGVPPEKMRGRATDEGRVRDRKNPEIQMAVRPTEHM
ncbi:hypothetical protein E2K80_02010 [Rhodophyticola sp. CCM32]|uniref:sulfotransferase n=1 Tax=Rhodophyticola sp. CCM32 TaxID=2916397 RepID=UPI00107FA157|nr:sulfotransferase [Rhodophyticola sp. CCM32]QBX99649.1 hypothetical protein E2K80_02010 [Rhodophyticola sp. CCM32]